MNITKSISEILEEIQAGIDQAQEAINSAEEAVTLIANLEAEVRKIKAVKAYNVEQTENKVLSQMREKEHELHPGGRDENY